MSIFLTGLTWPAAAVLVVLLIVSCIIICLFRTQRIEETVNEAVERERAKHAKKVRLVDHSKEDNQ